jgi:hypothetical protein
VPFNVWLIIFTLVNLASRSLFLVVAVIPNSFAVIRVAAYGFFFVLNPSIVLCSVTGVVFYIVVCFQGFFCGPLVTTWAIVISLSLGVTYSVMAVLQSCRIYRALVKPIQHYLRSIVLNNLLQERFSTSLNGAESLTQEELSRLPSLRASDSLIGSECAICHERISFQELVRKLPGCSHSFHQTCIDDWLVQSPTCPLCRNNIRVSIL